MRFLLTGVGGPAGSALASQLSTRGHTVVGADVVPIENTALESCHLVPFAADDDYLPRLGELLRDHRIDVLIPSVSEELESVAVAKDTLGAHVVVGPPAAVAVAADKLTTMHCLEAAGVPIPWFGLPSEFADPAEAIAAAGGPIVTKPRRSRGGRGVHVLDLADATSAQGREHWSHLDDTVVLQRFAPGPEYAPVLFRSPGNPEVDLCVVLAKTALREGRVGNAVGVARVAVGDPQGAQVADVAARAVLAAGLTGPVDIDVRMLDDGSPVVLEINARFGANSAAAPELLGTMLDHVTSTAAATGSATASASVGA